MPLSDVVRCGFCSKTYDLTRVEVFARYADCSLWLTPCCRRQADDRSWKPDYTRVSTETDWKGNKWLV